MSRHYKQFTTVTPFSKFLAMVLFVTLPIITFYLGIAYEMSIVNKYLQTPTIRNDYVAKPTSVIPNTTPTPTLNKWETYKNPRGLLEATFSYPNSWYIYEENFDKSGQYYVDLDSQTFQDHYYLSVTINKIDNPKQLSLYNYIKNVYFIVPTTVTLEKVKTNQNNITFYQMNVQSKASGGSFWTESKDAIYIISYSTVDTINNNSTPVNTNDKSYQTMMVQLNQLLSTFKFID